MEHSVNSGGSVSHAFREELGQLYFYNGSAKNWSMLNYHYHDTCEIIMTMSDGVTVDIGGLCYKADVGDLFIIPRDEYHRIKTIENSSYKRYVLMFDIEIVRKMVEPLGFNFLRYFDCFPSAFIPKISLSSVALKQMVAYMEGLDPLYSNLKDPQSSSLFYLRMVEMLIYIQELYDFFHVERNAGEADCKQISFEMHDNDKERISQIKQYICNNIEKKLSLEMISEQFFISRYYLSHYFRKETGFSITQYVTMQKIIRAKHMLKQGCSITKVSMTLGYNSNSHFISVFHKFVGITPKRYMVELGHSKNQILSL